MAENVRVGDKIGSDMLVIGRTVFSDFGNMPLICLSNS
jgi:hypothetical protein